MNKELKLGEQVPYKGKLLEVKESVILCKGCIYQPKECSSVLKDVGPCRAYLRSDKKDVIYIDASKVTEYKITIKKTLRSTLAVEATSYTGALEIAKNLYDRNYIRPLEEKSDKQELEIY